MKRFAYVAILALTAGLFVVAPASADSHEEGMDDQKFTIHGEVRTRFEYLENFNDFQDETFGGGDDPADDSGSYWPYRVRIAAHGEFANNVIGHVELQNFGFFGDDNPTKSDPNILFGTFQNDIDDSEIQLYQGYLELRAIGGSPFSLRMGRQEHTLGNELHMGDNDFYGGTAFEGVRGMFDFEKWDLDLFYYNILEIDAFGVLFGGFAGDDNTTFAGATASFEFGENARQVLEPYILQWRDGCDGCNPAEKLNFWTLGARYGRSVNSTDDVEANAFDWNAELALQSGEFGVGVNEGDHAGSIFEGWFGYNWNHGQASRSRVHIGALVASGDDDQTDNDNDAYIFLYTDTHANNRLGDSDLQTLAFSYGGVQFGNFFEGGVTNFNVGYEVWADDGQHYFMAAYHQFTATEDQPFGGEDDIGSEIDLRYAYQYSKHVSIETGVAQFMPGDLILADFGSDDDAMRFWGQARLRW